MQNLFTGLRRQAGASFKKLAAFAAVATLASVAHVPQAQAARCSNDGNGNWTCAFKERSNSFRGSSLIGCYGLPLSRKVRYQVPEGTAPAGGWPVAYYYNGTVVVGSAQQNPFDARKGELFGAEYGPQIIHELLDDPSGTGKKYAVIAPEAPTIALVSQFWDTNIPVPYSMTNDACFLPDLFGEAASGAYGPINGNKRYAFGISSGGYNTSRMAVTFNGRSQWKALAIVSASYANCAGPLCVVPGLPGNHPPTKFYHGLTDVIVPSFTSIPYYDKLRGRGVATERITHLGGHEFTSQSIGGNGIKAWFDRY